MNMKRPGFRSMSLARTLMMSLALVIGFVITGDAQAWDGPPILAKSLISNASGTCHLHPLVEADRQAAHQCACSACRPVAARSNSSELRRPTETDTAVIVPWDTRNSLLSIARTLQSISSVVPLDERAFLEGRELLARTARRLI